MALADLVADPSGDIAALASYLDGLGPTERWAEVARLDRAGQRALYRRAAGRDVGLDHFVGDAGPSVQAVHDGRNTLPLPPRLRLFQKYFCRPEPDAAEPYLIGFNEGATRRLIGPGYFVAVPSDGPAGAVVFDYDRVPAWAPPSWPAVVPNTVGLQRFVFRGTHDAVRGVSSHVCIGAVFRGDRALDHYFVLCRRV